MSQFAARLAHRPSRRRSARRLVIEALEERAVPANDLTVVDAGVDDSADVRVQTTGHTTTISTRHAGAVVSVATIQAALLDPSPNVQEVIVTTAVAPSGTDGDEAGNILWDATSAGNLDFTGFGTGRSLVFRTVDGNGAIGDITLTAVAFLNNGTNDQISLAFDTAATGGSVTFQDDGLGSNTVIYTAEAVRDLTVTGGVGAFHFADDGFSISAADAGGAVSVTAGDVFISHQGGLTAGADFTVAADTLTLTDGTRVFASGNLSLTGTTSVTAGDNGGISALGNESITAPDVLVGAAVLDVGGNLTLAGANSVGLMFATITTEGTMTLTGGDIAVVGATWTATGDLNVNATLSVTADFAIVTGSGNVSISGGSSAGLNGLTVVADGSVMILATTVDLLNSTVLAGNDGLLELTGTAVNTDSVVLGTGGFASFHGAMTVSSSLDVRADGGMTFNDPVDGAADLLIESNGDVTFKQDVGTTTPLNDVTFASGRVRFGASDLSASSVTVGQLSAPIEATLSSGASINGNVTVLQTGNLAPGGLGTAGTMTVFGDVSFQDGDFAVDFGGAGASDQLRVRDNPNTLAFEGNVNISANARLGGGLGTGQLTAPSATIIDYAGFLTGQFLNAHVGVPVIVGTDALQVTTYGPPGVVVIPVPALPNGIAIGADPDDGSLFKAVLTGGGQLVFGKDWRDFAFLVVRNSTTASKLVVTTTANGADPAITFNAGILINGPMALVSAATTNIGSQFRATGYVKSAVIRDLINLDNARLEFGGVPANLTTITARNLFGDVITGSTISSLKVAQSLGAQVFVPGLPDSVLSAPAIGTVTAKGATIKVEAGGRLGAMTVTGEMFGGVDVESLGTLSTGSFQGEVKTQGAATTVKTTRRFDGTVTAGSIGSFTAGGGGSAFLTATGAVGAVLSKGESLALDVTAASVKSVKATGNLSGNGTTWDVANGVSSLTAGSISDLNLRAKFLGPMLVSGNAALGMAGDIGNSTFTLTGNDGTLGAFGLKSLTAKGRVDTTRFDVRAGNVGAVTVGRFYNSQLHVNYTPSLALPFNLGGTFGPGTFKLASFKTTAVPTADPSNPFQWAYQGSEIAAESIGAVTLSGLNTDNTGVAFGIKEQNPGAVVKVLAADAGFPASLLNKPLSPSNTAIGGDFFFLDV